MGTPLSSSSGPKLQFPSNLRPKLKDPTKMANLSVCRIGETTVLWAPIPNRFLRNAHLPTTRSFLLFFFFSSSFSRKSCSCLAVSPSCARASLCLFLVSLCGNRVCCFGELSPSLGFGGVWRAFSLFLGFADLRTLNPRPLPPSSLFF